MTGKINRAFIGNRIALYRKANGITQSELAEKVGVGRTSITNIENGYQNATVDLLYRIVNALDITLADIVENDRVAHNPLPFDEVED